MTSAVPSPPSAASRPSPSSWGWPPRQYTMASRSDPATLIEKATIETRSAWRWRLASESGSGPADGSTGSVTSDAAFRSGW